ncbi:hypothetical protein QOZ80_1AG0022740 [Eleusine coracana subsp. coracana]|nr:hypothetical protein QOZ80_1AG0022740 [Eleusine coracana subsp. coracana]
MAPLNRGRVVVFPLPFHGHVNPMLRLAAALHGRGLAVTVLHADHCAPDPAAHPAAFRFVPVRADVPAGLMASLDVAGVVTALNAIFAAPFKDRLCELLVDGDGVRCVVTDVVWYSAQTAARELGVPALGLMTSSAASFRTFVAYPTLLDKGYLPVQESRKEDPVHELPPFRVKDLQRVDSSSLAGFAGMVARVVAEARQSSGLILNTFDAIEAGDVNDIRDNLQSIPVFAVGPLHKLAPPPTKTTSAQDRAGCLEWLDAQAPRSVLFVSLGTVAAIDAREFAELARGLVGSNRPFLWVVRPSLVRDTSGKLLHPPVAGVEEEEETRGGRGRIVPWAPQEEVLAHPAVGAFLTHNGWNSTMEAVSEGVPMICRPCFGDQLGTARYVCDVWQVGVEVGDRLERGDVEAAIEKVMGGGGAEGKVEVREKMKGLKERTDECANEGGLSYTALTDLVDLMLSF